MNWAGFALTLAHFPPLWRGRGSLAMQCGGPAPSAREQRDTRGCPGDGDGCPGDALECPAPPGAVTGGRRRPGRAEGRGCRGRHCHGPAVGSRRRGSGRAAPAGPRRRAGSGSAAAAAGGARGVPGAALHGGKRQVCRDAGRQGPSGRDTARGVGERRGVGRCRRSRGESREGAYGCAFAFLLVGQMFYVCLRLQVV